MTRPTFSPLLPSWPCRFFTLWAQAAPFRPQICKSVGFAGTFRRWRLDRVNCHVCSVCVVLLLVSGVLLADEMRITFQDTEIDWETYMYHIDLINNGERNYTAIAGPTGPLVSVCRRMSRSKIDAIQDIQQDMSKSTNSFTVGLPLASTSGSRSTSLGPFTSTAASDLQDIRWGRRNPELGAFAPSAEQKAAFHLCSAAL